MTRTLVALLFCQIILAGCGTPASNPPVSANRILDVASLTTEQIKALDRSRTVALMPGGILEEHGPYLPSYADGYQSEFLATRVAEAMSARGWTVLRFPSLSL